MLKTKNIFPLLHEQNYFIFRILPNFTYIFRSIPIHSNNSQGFPLNHAPNTRNYPKIS